MKLLLKRNNEEIPACLRNKQVECFIFNIIQHHPTTKDDNRKTFCFIEAEINKCLIKHSQGLLTTLVFGGVRMKGQIQAQYIWGQILFLKPGYHQHLLKMLYTSSEMISSLLTNVH